MKRVLELTSCYWDFFLFVHVLFLKKTIEVTETLEQTEIPSRAKHGEISPWAKVAIVREATD